MSDTRTIQQIASEARQVARKALTGTLLEFLKRFDVPGGIKDLEEAAETFMEGPEPCLDPRERVTGHAACCLLEFAQRRLRGLPDHSVKGGGRG